MKLSKLEACSSAIIPKAYLKLMHPCMALG